MAGESISKKAKIIKYVYYSAYLLIGLLGMYEIAKKIPKRKS
jgi:hypothetical protein